MTMDSLRDLFARPGANDLPVLHPTIGRPMTLRSARPRRCTPATPILFVHHGVNRNGDDYRDYWLPLVDEADVMVIAPEFPNDGFPGSPWYNYGNRTDDSGAEKPRAEWTYGIDQLVFQALQAQGLTQRPGYGVFGHSAGGQFVHRMLSLGFREQVACAVTANAGSYALPDLQTPWPFGLAGTGLGTGELSRWLGFRLTVMAGTADCDPNSSNLPREDLSMAQGTNRYDRAHHFIRTARAQAETLGIACAWTIVDVAGVAHDGEKMSAAAAPIVSAALHAG